MSRGPVTIAVDHDRGGDSPAGQGQSATIALGSGCCRSSSQDRPGQTREADNAAVFFVRRMNKLL